MGSRNIQSSIILIVVLCAVALINCYPSGSPKCSAHTPKHSSSKAQTGKAPYKITTSSVTKDKNGKSTITVTIAGTNDSKFKGFFLYATAVDSNDKIGKFTKSSNTSVLSCGSSSAATHTNNDEKSSISLTWTAPDNFTGNVEFKATVVKEFKEFWTGIKSSAVNIA